MASAVKAAYTAPAAETARLASAGASARVIAGSGYLGSLVPESATLHATLARALEARGSGAEALREWQTELRLDPTLVEGHFRVGMLLGAIALAAVVSGGAWWLLVGRTPSTGSLRVETDTPGAP